ncbi:MAG: hypothetical protein R3E79_22495 [Caldilineaceae bacterium]
MVNLDAGENITVTFANTKQPSHPCTTHIVTNTAVLVGSTGIGGIGSGYGHSNSDHQPLCLQTTATCLMPTVWLGSPTSPDYNTNITGTAGASHLIIPGLYLGSLVDDEMDGQPSAAATGDDMTDTPDDEDGVTFPDLYPGCGAAIGVSVVNTIGSTAILYGFIDWNGDTAVLAPVRQ